MHATIKFDPYRPLDLICMGRVAVDLYAEQIHSSLSHAQTMRKYLGGCAGNIAVGTSRLGLKCAMFSCIGKDDMGQFLRETLNKERVNTDLLYESDQHLTGLVLLGVNPPNNFPLIFYRKDCADMQLKPEHVKADYLAQSKALLVTGTGLSTPSMRETTLHAVELAKQLDTAVVIDLDYRPVLWGLTTAGDGETRYKASHAVSDIYKEVLHFCDLIVGTEEEIRIAGGEATTSDAILTLRKYTQAPIVMKLGEKGCLVYLANRAEPLSSRPFPVEVLNVLGAGDAFMSGLLCGLLTGASWQTATTYANASGALVVTRHGCAPAIPHFEELVYFIEHYDQQPALWKSSRLSLLHRQVILGKARTIHEHIVLADANNKNLPNHKAIYAPIQEEEDESFYEQILKRPAHLGIKFMWHYHADMPAEIKKKQIHQLKKLARSCDALERRLMLELITPDLYSVNTAIILEAIKDVYQSDIYPFCWRLDNLSDEAKQQINTMLSQYDPYAAVVEVIK